MQVAVQLCAAGADSVDSSRRPRADDDPSAKLVLKNVLLPRSAFCNIAMIFEQDALYANFVQTAGWLKDRDQFESCKLDEAGCFRF